VELRTAPLERVLDAFASSEPLPGGGSAAALTGAIGASLLQMVAGMTKTRTGTPEEVAELSAAAARLQSVREQLTTLVDEDSRAYLTVIAAYRQPKATPEEQARRLDAIQAALRVAIEAPLQTMRLCERALNDAPVVCRSGNPNAAADAVVGTKLLVAALDGAGLNVDVNLPRVTDPDYVSASTDERRSLQTRAKVFAEQAQA
jgi:formiminotetrahydrofolate cyclodeaminase